MEKEVLISQEILNRLPTIVKSGLAKLSPAQQSMFIEEYKKKRKSVGIAYIAWFLLGFHYIYLKRSWLVQILFWITAGGFAIWWVVDAFRIPSMVRMYNEDVAIDVLKDLKVTLG